jgi:hypothetical protein
MIGGCIARAVGPRGHRIEGAIRQAVRPQDGDRALDGIEELRRLVEELARSSPVAAGRCPSSIEVERDDIRSKVIDLMTCTDKALPSCRLRSVGGSRSEMLSLDQRGRFSQGEENARERD